MRVACLLVPDLPLHAELRAHPELANESLVITTAPGTRSEILNASPRALAQGIRAGLSLPQARALAHDLVVLVASPLLEQTARETLLDIGLSLAPRTELAPRASGLFCSEGAIHVDASGIEALHGNERAFASVLQARAERAGLPGFVALASSRSIARLAARHLAHQARDPSKPADPQEGAIRIVSPGEEIAFLSPLSIDLLEPGDRIAEALTRFGIHRIHDLLRLSRRDLAARLGTGILELVARARGEETGTPIAEPRNGPLEESLDLEVPISSLEPLTFVLRGLTSRLLERLRLRSLGCFELHLEMELEEGAREIRRIGLASATQDEQLLLRLLRSALESKPPGAAVLGVRLRSEGVPLHREQLDFFLPRGPGPSALDQTLAALGALCGPDRVGAPTLLDDHRPDAFALKPFRPNPSIQSARSGTDRPGSSTEGPRLGLRALRPPLRAEVRTRRGKPAFIRSTMGEGEILVSAGPWRTTGHWWSESTHFAVDHYDIQMSDGTVARLCFDWRTKWWQIDGLYD